MVVARRRNTRKEGSALPMHVEGRGRKDTRLSCPQLIAFVSVMLISCYGILSWTSTYQLKKMLYTPQQSPKIVPEKHDMRRYWGSYRPQVYFGMKTLSPRSIVTGLMWLEQYKQYSQDLPLRHTCEQGDRLPKYGWIAHDGQDFGMQDIVERTFMLRTEFVKRPGGDHGGDWSWRITGRGIHGETTISLFFYVATDGEGDIKAHFVKEGKDSMISHITGHTEDLGGFTIRFPKSSTVAKQQFHHTVTEVEGLHKLKDGVLRKLSVSSVTSRGSGGKKTPFYFVVDGDTSASKVKDPKSKMIVHQVSIETPFEIEMLFESSSVKTRRTELAGSTFTDVLGTLRTKFDQKFEYRFPLRSRGYGEEEIAFAKAAFSNMIGGIGHFYGSSLVQSRFFPEPIPYWEAHLLTAVPSRSFFPRGFLWDEGFHQLLISKWDRELSLLILSHWLDTMNNEGWIPREQILGDEARSKVPAEFVVQRNTNANPPTFFLALKSIMSDMKESHKGMSEKERELVAKMYPKLQAWYNWFNTTQVGPVPGSYRWRGRNPDSDSELNPKTLTSGLDDYPRSSHPTDDERHLDLRCWMAFASETLAQIATEIGEDPTPYQQTSDFLADNKLLAKLHWSDKLKMFADYGNHTAKVALIRKQFPPERPGMPATARVIRQSRAVPKSQFVNARGYVSLFPFLLKQLEPNSPKLKIILEDLKNPEFLWTEYGLRSLSKSDPLYMKRNTEHDPPYWRGPIWININYLAIRALKYYATQSDPPISEMANDAYNSLRRNVIQNIFNQYKRTGYIWENYNDGTGAGQGCHPFTGWSALVVLMMSEQYGE